jgi:hypothetical protein
MGPDSEDFDIFHSIEIQKDIIMSLHQYNPSFEEGVEESIQSLKQALDQLGIKAGYYQHTLNGEKNVFDSSDEVALEKLEQYGMERELLTDQLIALGEMQIIYLFKNLEISLKSLIKIAYPKVNVKPFYKWELIKMFFDEKGILLNQLEGFAEVDQARKVNNNIKHTDEFTSELKRIPEFKDGMEYEDLERFFKRVKPKVAAFQNKLSEAVVKELYEFDERKLNALTDELRERMTKEDAEKYIGKVKEKFGLK